MTRENRQKKFLPRWTMLPISENAEEYTAPSNESKDFPVPPMRRLVHLGMFYGMPFMMTVGSQVTSRMGAGEGRAVTSIQNPEQRPLLVACFFFILGKENCNLTGCRVYRISTRE